ncbi:MAG TPA: hypothetical protein VII95_05485 [Terriglobales bacterium]|jgi:hypothetical protein
MNEWSFWDYIDERGINLIQEWLMNKHEVPVKARAKIQLILLRLAGTALWTRPLASNLDDYDGIVEIRICRMNVQYRLLGFRGPDERQFTILFPAKEQGDEFVPRTAPQIAQTRMHIVIADRSRVREHSFR